MRRTRWATAQVSWLGLLVPALLTLVGCGDIDAGSTPFPGTVLYVDPAAAYQFHLLEPPWIPAPFDTVTVFVVPPSNLNDVTDLSAAIYSLHIDTVLGTPQGNRDTEASGVINTSTVPASKIHLVEGTLRTVSGASGYELSWQPAAGLFERDAFLAGPSTATFRLQFGAKEPISDDDMITQMILSFEPL
jgi:hypothetical protein